MSGNVRPYRLSRLRRALVHFLIGRAVQAGARALLILVLIRLLPLHDYGAYMVLLGLAEMQLPLASFGMLAIGRRYLPQMVTTLPARKLYRFVALLIAAQTSVLCLITFGLWSSWSVITPWLGFSAEQSRVAEPAVLLFLLIPALRFCAELLEALLEQAKSQSVRAFMPIGRLLGIAALIVLGIQVDLRAILIIDAAITGAGLIVASLFLQASLRKLHATDGQGDLPVREMLRFAWHMAGADVMSAAGAPGAIRLALANTLGVLGSGLFAFLQSLERLVGRYLPGVLLSGLIRPMLISRAFLPGGTDVLRAGSALLFKANLIIVAAGTVAIAVAGDPLVAWASGGKFPTAGFTLLLMFLALSFKAQRSVIEMIMQITGHTSILRTTAFIAPVTLLAVWLVADQGINIAVSILALGSVLSVSIVALVLSRSVENYRIDWRGLGAAYLPVLLAVPAGILACEVMHPFAAAALAVTGYMASLILTKPFRADEIGLLEQVFGRRPAAFARILSQTGVGGTIPGPTV